MKSVIIISREELEDIKHRRAVILNIIQQIKSGSVKLVEGLEGIELHAYAINLEVHEL